MIKHMVMAAAAVAAISVAMPASAEEVDQPHHELTAPEPVPELLPGEQLPREQLPDGSGVETGHAERCCP